MNKKIKFLDVKDKHINVYSKFNTDEFWNFINPGEQFYYELRIKSPRADEKNYKLIKQLASLIKVHYHYSGVFVKKKIEFRQTVAFCLKKKLTLYLSANPKRISYHKENAEYKTFNGKMQSDLCFFSLLIDFDATKKAKELFKLRQIEISEIAYQVAKRFLVDNTKITKYCMLCSGNGIQLRIPLDEVIYLPKDTYDAKREFIITEEFNIFRRILKVALSSILKKYNSKYISVDTSSLELARVGRCPFSINWKDEKMPRYSGLIEIVDTAENKDLSTFILSHKQQVLDMIKKEGEYGNNQKLAEEHFSITKETLREFPPIKYLLLNPNCPEGGRNNIIFYQVKLYISNRGWNINDSEIAEVIEECRRVQHHTFVTNNPGQGIFNPEAIINFCIDRNFIASKSRATVYDVLYNIKEKKINLDESYLKFKRLDIKQKLDDTYHKKIAIIRYIKKNNFNFRNKELFKLEINKLMNVIYNTYGKETLDYLIESNVLKILIEKTVK